MCEYCGCQALKAVDLLTREHELVVNLIGRIREGVAAGDIDRVADLARAIGGVLVPHTRVEEDGLFPLMDAEFPDHVAVLRAEHRQVEEVLAEAANGTPSDGLWPQRLTAALYLLREHILKEQDGLFPQRSRAWARRSGTPSTTCVARSVAGFRGCRQPRPPDCGPRRVSPTSCCGQPVPPSGARDQG